MTSLTTVRIPPAEREQLQRWAAHYQTNMMAEVLRSIRERIEREQAAQQRQGQAAS